MRHYAPAFGDVKPRRGPTGASAVDGSLRLSGDGTTLAMWTTKRFGARAKQTAAISGLVGAAVIVQGTFYVIGVSRLVLRESLAAANLLTDAIFHRAHQALSADVDPYRTLREDAGLRSILEASVLSNNVLTASIVDSNGVIVASSDRAAEGLLRAQSDSLGDLVEGDVMSQLRVIYSLDGRTFEVREPLKRGDEDFGSVSVAVSTLLIRQALNDSLRPALLTAVATVIGAMTFGALLAQLWLRPHVQ